MAGTVTDAGTGQPLAGVTVLFFIEGTEGVPFTSSANWLEPMAGSRLSSISARSWVRWSSCGLCSGAIAGPMARRTCGARATS